MSLLKPEASVMAAIATSALVIGIYQHGLPTLADHKLGDVGDQAAKTSGRTADWTATGTVALLTLLTKDPTVFSMGAASIIAMSLWHRLANYTDPITQALVGEKPMAASAENVEAVNMEYSPV